MGAARTSGPPSGCSSLWSRRLTDVDMPVDVVAGMLHQDPGLLHSVQAGTRKLGPGAEFLDLPPPP